MKSLFSNVVVVLILLFYSIVPGYGQVNSVCDKILEVVTGGSTHQLAFCSNKDLTANDAVTHAVLLMHGQDRNAPNRYSSLLTSAGLSGAHPDSVVLITPQFLIEEDLIAHGLTSDYLHWTNVWNGWKYGYDNSSTVAFPSTAEVSSFEVMELLLSKVESSFPNLKSMVITGHSAGGQFVNRFAAANQFENQDPSFCISYVSLNAGTYLYMSEERRVGGTIDQFAVPTTCSSHNRYKYGMSSFNGCGYMEGIGFSTIESQLGHRRHTILVGENDNDPNDGGINNNDCKELVQGEHRVERAQIYYNHLQRHYENDIENIDLQIVPGAGHSTHEMITSDIGRRLLFDIECCMDNIISQAFTGCEEIILPDGQIVTESGEYTYVEAGGAGAGCDNIYETYVEVWPVEYVDTLVSIAAGDEFVLADGSIVTTAGTYEVVVPQSSPFGCDVVYTYTITITTSTSELNRAGSLTLYPNPVQEVIVIDGDPSKTYHIIDARGSVVWTGTRQSVDISHFPAGLYICTNGIEVRKFAKL